MSSNTPRDRRTMIGRLRASLQDRTDDYAMTPAFTDRVQRLRRRRRIVRRVTAAAMATAVVAVVAFIVISALAPADRVDFITPPPASPSPTATVDATQPSPRASHPPSPSPADTPTATPSPSGTPSARTAPPAERQLTADTPISLYGIGPIEAGMTLADAERAAGVDLIPRHFEDFGGSCYYAVAEGLEEDFVIMVRAPGSEPVERPEDGIVSSVSAHSAMASPARTVSGIGVGSAEEDVYDTYRGQIDSEPHFYVEGGHYLTLVPRDPSDQEYRVKFATDGEVVLEIHAGLANATAAVEGCA